MNISLKTEIAINQSQFDINYQTPIVLLGSCFSDNIGSTLNRLKFPVLQNPFGVLYNPISISQSLIRIINKTEIKRENLIKHNNLWHSFSFHGSFSGNTETETIELTNNAIYQSHSFLKKANYLFVTFGTAWVFQHKKTNIIVANCHKILSSEFSRYRLSIEKIVDEWNLILDNLFQFNPDLKVVFTISPVRHLKDGAYENQLSKSTLFLAIEELLNSKHSEKLTYFPSYEIIHDELRDYRFYADDMIHISNKAVDYIFEKFKATFFNKSTKICSEELHLLSQSVTHKILSTNRTEIQKFAESMLKKIKILEDKYPYVNFKLEINYFKNL